MTGKSATIPVAQKWQWPLLGAFGDLRIRYGIKLGLAALLALYCALLLRLEHPNWAVLTALVMMGSQLCRFDNSRIDYAGGGYHWWGSDG